MRTEEQIVYELLNIYHGGQVSNDNTVSERLMRSFLRKHRASKLYKYSQKGLSVPSETFQYLGELSFTWNNKNGFERTLPALIDLRGYGILVNKLGQTISISDQMSYILAIRNKLNNHIPTGMLWGNKLTLSKGNYDKCRIHAGSLMASVTEAFEKESTSFSDTPEIKAEVFAVLYDPDQAPGYDWTRDPYPCPSEIIDELTVSVKAKDLNLMIRAHLDTEVNAMDDKQPSR